MAAYKSKNCLFARFLFKLFFKTSKDKVDFLVHNIYF